MRKLNEEVYISVWDTPSLVEGGGSYTKRKKQQPTTYQQVKQLLTFPPRNAVTQTMIISAKLLFEL